MSIPTHYMRNFEDQAACGVPYPDYSSDRPEEVNCRLCWKTGKFKNAVTAMKAKEQPKEKKPGANLHRPSRAAKTRKRINQVSEKRKAWLAMYKVMKMAYTPTACARCEKKGTGWKDRGGDFEPHHIARRRTEWQVCLFVPLCPECHEEVEHNATKAREDGWIIDPKTVSMFRG